MGVATTRFRTTIVAIGIAFLCGASGADGDTHSQGLVQRSEELRRAGRLSEAVEVAEQAVREARELGEATPQLSVALRTLATALEDQERWEDAARASKESVSIADSIYESDDSGLLLAKQQLAFLLCRIERCAEAEQVLLGIVAATEQSPSHDADSRAARLLNVANYYSRQGHVEKAVSFYKKALSARTQGEPDADMGMDLVLLGDALRELGRVADAREAYQQAVEVLRIGEGRIALAQAKEGLGTVLVEQGDIENGLRELEEARLLLSAAAGKHSKLLRAFAERYAAILEEVGRVDDAERVRAESPGIEAR
jgi:tetratricopeptide (TPR) repeat protein